MSADGFQVNWNFFRLTTRKLNVQYSSTLLMGLILLVNIELMNLLSP